MAANTAEEAIIKQIDATLAVSTKDSLAFLNSQLVNIPDHIARLADRLVILDLSKNRISSLPLSLGQFSVLSTLRLRANALSNIPEGVFGGLKLLNELDLVDNELVTLPTDLGQATTLERLFLTGNLLTALPPSITNLSNLRELVVSENRITELPEGLNALDNLEKLDAQENAITRLPDSLTLCKGLRSLSLQNNQLTALPDKMWQLESLAALHLQENPWDEDRLPSKLLVKRAKAIISYLLAASEGRTDDANEILEYSLNAPVRQKSASRISAQQKKSGGLEARPPLIRETSGFKASSNPPPSPRYEPVASEIPSGIVNRASMSLRRASTIEPSKESQTIAPRPRPAKPSVLARAPTQVTEADTNSATPPVSARARPPSSSVSGQASPINHGSPRPPSSYKVPPKAPARPKAGTIKSPQPGPRPPMRSQISTPSIAGRPNNFSPASPKQPTNAKIENTANGSHSPQMNGRARPQSMAIISEEKPTAAHLVNFNNAKPNNDKVIDLRAHAVSQTQIEPTETQQPSDAPATATTDGQSQPVSVDTPVDPTSPNPVPSELIAADPIDSMPTDAAPVPQTVEVLVEQPPVISTEDAKPLMIAQPADPLDIEFTFDPVAHTATADPIADPKASPENPKKPRKPKTQKNPNETETITLGVSPTIERASSTLSESNHSARNDSTPRGRPKTRRILDSENPVGTPFYTSEALAYLPRKLAPGPLIKITSKRFVTSAPVSSQVPEWSEVFSSDNMALLPTGAYTGYANDFQGQKHYNFVGEDQVDGGYVVVSYKEADEETNCVIRTKNGDSELSISLPAKTPKDASGWLAHLRKNGDFAAVVPKHVKLSHVADSSFPDVLQQLERKLGRTYYKFGVVYAKEGQTEEDEYLLNESGSPEFDEFLDWLGDRIPLQGWDRYDGGLDTQKNATGTHSIFTEWKDLSIMFHVSTLMPLCAEGDDDDEDGGGNNRIVEKKVHIGNDIVVVVFMEGDSADSSFNPRKFVSHFNHAFIVINPVRQKGLTLYRVNTVYKSDVPPCRPTLPVDAIFEKSDQLRELLLAKMVNSDRAACLTTDFAASLASLRYHQLYNAGKQYQGKPPKAGCFAGCAGK